MLKTVLPTLAAVPAAFVLLLSWAMAREAPPRPALAGHVERGELVHEQRARTWLAYVPAKPAEAPALVVVLHAAMGTPERARRDFGWAFDALADREGFVVAYPQGIGGRWNDCRKRGAFEAKRENVDDVGFLRVLVDRLVAERHVDRARVYVAGVSNGGAMALRLALEAPDLARAYASVVASLSAPDNLDAVASRRPVSVLLMNGTRDPMNPWDGGEVALYGVWGHRGRVLSTRASIDYFRALDGLDVAPEIVRVPDVDATDGSTVERATWRSTGKPIVSLYTIEGGGHQVPNPAADGMRLLGRTNRDIRAADEIWRFFEAAPTR